jgi:AraC-like DNA-binding protein
MATVSASVTKAMLALARSRGLSRAALLERAGLTEADLADPDARVPVETNSALWTTVADALGDEAIGLEFAQQRPSVEFMGVAAVLAQSGQTAEDALRMYARYYPLQSEDATATYQRTADGGVVRWTSEADPAEARHFEDALVAACVVLGRAWTGHDIVPIRVALRRPRPKETDRYESLFRCPLEFAARSTEVFVAHEDLVRPIKTPPPDVMRYLVVAADALAERMHRERPEQEQVLAAFRAVGTEQGAVADHLGWTVRTLQRRLLLAGTSYQALVDEHRKRIAAIALADPSLALVQIAHLCGYETVRSLQRALRRWQLPIPSNRRDTAPAEPEPAASPGSKPRRK